MSDGTLVSDGTLANSPASLSTAAAAAPASARPVAARTRLLLEGPVLPTLLRLSAPNVLNLLAIAGIRSTDYFSAVLAPTCSRVRRSPSPL
jgi:hypothetical protein